MKDKLINVFWVTLLFAAAYGLYMVKYRVEDVRQQVIETERALNGARDELHMLRAEWAYLNRPQRLSKLVVKHLDMVPMNGERVVEVSVLPQRVVEDTDLVPASYTGGAQ